MGFSALHKMKYEMKRYEIVFLGNIIGLGNIIFESKLKLNEERKYKIILLEEKIQLEICVIFN